MKFIGLRPISVLPPCLLLPLAAQAAAYELPKETYDRLSVLPAYDHDGTLPAGESRAYEIEWIDRERVRRDYYITTFEAQLPLVVATAHTPDAKQQLREDMASRRETHNRWDESAIRRRDAIVTAATYKETNEALQGKADPTWTELKRELTVDSTPSFAERRKK